MVTIELGPYSMHRDQCVEPTNEKSGVCFDSNTLKLSCVHVLGSEKRTPMESCTFLILSNKRNCTDFRQ